MQAKAGTQAALDGLKIAQGPRDLSRMARLAETKGTRTRAILKTLGRGAIVLTSSAFTLFSWLFSAVMPVCELPRRGQAHDRTRHRALLSSAAGRGSRANGCASLP